MKILLYAIYFRSVQFFQNLTWLNQVGYTGQEENSKQKEKWKVEKFNKRELVTKQQWAIKFRDITQDMR